MRARAIKDGNTKYITLRQVSINADKNRNKLIIQTLMVNLRRVKSGKKSKQLFLKPFEDS